jgi:hypothetical protein
MELKNELKFEDYFNDCSNKQREIFYKVMNNITKFENNIYSQEKLDIYIF